MEVRGLEVLTCAWLLAGLACEAPVDDRPAPVEVSVAPVGDPLLARARERFAGGHIDDEIEAAIRASSAPAHARARRILEAIAEPPSVPAEEPASASAVPIVPPPIPVVASVQDVHTSTEIAAATPVPTTKHASPVSTTRSSSTPTTTLPPRLDRIALAPATSGATLSLGASSGVVVGVVREPERGLVRLVLEASAGGQALAARPRVEGARVTDVQATGRSLIVTLELDPGWRLGTVTRTREGARVRIDRP